MEGIHREEGLRKRERKGRPARNHSPLPDGDHAIRLHHDAVEQLQAKKALAMIGALRECEVPIVRRSAPIFPHSSSPAKR